MTPKASAWSGWPNDFQLADPQPDFSAGLAQASSDPAHGEAATDWVASATRSPAVTPLKKGADARHRADFRLPV